ARGARRGGATGVGRGGGDAPARPLALEQRGPARGRVGPEGEGAGGLQPRARGQRGGRARVQADQQQVRRGPGRARGGRRAAGQPEEGRAAERIRGVSHGAPP
ncbi:MAG: hypothetical protein ACK559_34115, partial [bacterium]